MGRRERLLTLDTLGLSFERLLPVNRLEAI